MCSCLCVLNQQESFSFWWDKHTSLLCICSHGNTVAATCEPFASRRDLSSWFILYIPNSLNQIALKISGTVCSQRLHSCYPYPVEYYFIFNSVQSIPIMKSNAQYQFIFVYSNIHHSFQKKDCSAHVVSSIIIQSCHEVKYRSNFYLSLNQPFSSRKNFPKIPSLPKQFLGS